MLNSVNAVHIVVVVAAIFFGLFLTAVQEKPVDLEHIKLGAGGYDIEPLVAPSARGMMLTAIAYVLSATPFGPPLRRILLNGNRVHLLRALAAQAPHLPPLHHPLHRLSVAEHKIHDLHANATDSSLPKVLRTGLGKVTKENAEQLKQYLLNLKQDKSDNSAFVPPTFWAIEDYHNAYKSQVVTPVDVMDVLLTFIESNTIPGVFSSVIPDYVRQQAVASAQRWKKGSPISVLDGVPIAVKDMITVKGHPMYDGAKPSASQQIEREDDPIVKRLRLQGAIIVGLTVMTESGVTPLGYAPFFSGPLNPHNENHYPGGSSSGSGVAVAQGLLPAAIGFDGGGSIRIPAAFSGCVGYATSFARLPFGRRKTTTTMIKSGVLAGTVADAAIVYAAIADNDTQHYYSQLYGQPGLPPPHLHGINASKEGGGRNMFVGKKFGIFRAHFNDTDAEVLAGCNKAVEWMQAHGATIVDITIPHMQILSLAHGMKISTEFALGLDHKMFAPEAELEANTRLTVALGSSISALEIISAERLRHWAFKYVKDLFESHGLSAIISPTVGMTAPEIIPAALETGEYNVPLTVKMMKHIFLANLLGLPAISIPIGLDTNRLPFALQLTGDHWTDDQLLSLSRIIDEHYSNGKNGNSKHRPKHFYDVLGATVKQKKP